MKSIRSAVRHTQGSTLAISLFMLMVLAFVGANLLLTVTSRYGYTQNAIGWQKASPAAEAGAEYGLANCRWAATGASTPWSAWKKYDSTSQSWIAVTNAADANAELTAGRTVIYDLPAASRLAAAGNGSNTFWYHVEVDAPSSLIVSGNPWYRIRSTGYASLASLVRSGNDLPDGTLKHNNMLRKLDLRYDHFIERYGDYAHAAGTAVSVQPQATRRVEMIAKPVTVFSVAILAAAATGSSVSIPIVDSYNSTDSVNYPGGLYSSTPRNTATGIGVNAIVYSNSPVSSISASIYGIVETNGGSVVKTSNITGSVSNNVSLSPPPVIIPTWAYTASSAAPSTLTAGTSASPLYASYTSVNGLTVNLPAGQTTGIADVYVTGDVGGGITVAKGVTLKLWFEGNFSMKARDINNSNNNAANLQFYGIDPAAGVSRTFDLGSGNPGFRYFTLDAPGYDFSVNGNPDFCGAWIVKTVNGNGNTSWHYDEALASVGPVMEYKRASWVEDPR
jgi:hypothetical protein